RHAGSARMTADPSRASSAGSERDRKPMTRDGATDGSWRSANGHREREHSAPRGERLAVGSAQSSFHGLLANTASSGHSARLGIARAAMMVAAMSSAYSLFGLLRPVRPPKFVWTSEGHRLMTRIPCGRSSACQHWLMPRTAHLLPPYAVPAAPPFIPEVEAMLTMSPSPRSFIIGTMRLVMSTSPNTLT